MFLRRPRRTMGADIFLRIDGPRPTDVKDCAYLATDSQSPYVVEYEASDAGKMATTCSAGACATAQPSPSAKQSASR